MLETHELRKNANKLRQELSYALYKEDAAVRVLARVMRERDEARQALASVQSSLGVVPQTLNSAMDVDEEPQQAVEEGLTGEAAKRVADTHKR